MKRILMWVCLCVVGGCAYRNPVSDMQFQTTAVPPYVVANWYKITAPGEAVKIYIEDDGPIYADVPTPVSELTRRLAAEDPAPNVVYLARPCQYLQAGCEASDWQRGRYAAEAVGSMDGVVVRLMKKATANQVILVGVGGGAQIAGEIAAKHPERVRYLITLGGILDREAWARYRGEAAFAPQTWRVRDIPVAQMHFAGEKDTVVPPALISQAADHVQVISGATHDSGWDKAQQRIYEVQ